MIPNDYQLNAGYGDRVMTQCDSGLIPQCYDRQIRLQQRFYGLELSSKLREMPQLHD